MPVNPLNALPGMWSAATLGLCLLALSACASFHTSTASFKKPSATVIRHTLKDLRDRFVVKQNQDYSCGAAALATLLSYYYGEHTSEHEILTLLKAQIPEEEWDRKSIMGFSLLDLKDVAHTKGFRAAGFELTIEQLTQLQAPVIVFIEPLGYKHFAVLRGIDRGRVYLADPSRGNLRMSIHRFLEEWSGIIFVLGKDEEDTIRDYPLAIPRPPVINPELHRFEGTWRLGRAPLQGRR